MKPVEAMAVTLAAMDRRGGWAPYRDLARHGVTNRQLRAMMAGGAIRRVHVGIYALSATAEEPLTRIAVALEAAGPGAIASHRTAAWLQGLVDDPGPGPLLHVTVPDRTSRRPAGVRIHHARGPLPSLAYQGVRCTTPPRTLRDLAGSVSPRRLDAMVDQALVSGITRVADLTEAARAGGRGSARLRLSLTGFGHLAAPDASRLESEMRRLVHRYQLPRPAVQVRAGQDGRYRLDCAWEADRLAVELYGYAWHHSPEQMEHDLHRQRQLVLEGWTVLIFTWRDVICDPARVAGQIAEALRRLRS